MKQFLKFKLNGMQMNLYLETAKQITNHLMFGKMTTTHSMSQYILTAN